MPSKMTQEVKEIVLAAMREHGTMQYGAKAAGVSVRTLNNEMNRSAVFKRRLLEAREEGKRNIADKAIEMIRLYASGTVPKTDRNVLTANIALANAYEPGFRGTTTIQGKVEHDIRVLTAVPRPRYDGLPIITIEPPKQLKKGKPDEQN